MGDAARIRLEESWKRQLLPEFAQPYMQNLKSFLQEEKDAGRRVYPPGGEIFAALDLTPFEQVKVVILGQDPYHGPNQAHGLCFSVRPGTAVPPSLLNIYKELKEDLDFTIPEHGFLQSWAKQGVLLLNATLSVRAGLAGSHQGKGWESFTDRIVHLLNDQGEHLVFMLWGSYAQKKGAFIDQRRHLVLKAPHPSPLSAHRGFFGCRHFSQANRYLEAHGKTPVNWQLPLTPSTS